jgi:hypothetical protein
VNQNQQVLRALKRGPLDPLTAWKQLAVYRLGARIYDLKQQGHTIKSRIVKQANGKKFARYLLVQ